MNKKPVTILDFVNKWVDIVGSDLRCMAGRKGMNNIVTHSINRPGLALSGRFVEFGKNRIQLFGRGEVKFLNDLDKDNKLKKVLDNFFQQEIACCVCSHSKVQSPPQMFIEYCEKHHIPLFFSSFISSELSNNIFQVLNDLFAPHMILHGVFLEVHDLGVLLTGDSGIGKSEIALELIERNKSRLIADDVVKLKKIRKEVLEGTSVASKQLQHNLEIRGLGLVSIPQIYGIDTTLDKKELHLVIHLHKWNESMKSQDRLEKEEVTELLEVEIPLVNLFIKAGRNVALMIEIAAIKQRLIYMGFHGKENPYLW